MCRRCRYWYRDGHDADLDAISAPVDGVEDAAPDAHEMKAFCKERLAIYKVPREVSFRNNVLPRTASGKVDRGKFLKMVKDQS